MQRTVSQMMSKTRLVKVSNTRPTAWQTIKVFSGYALFFLVITALLVGCSSPKKQQAKQQIQQPVTTEKKPEQSYQSLIAKAQGAHQQGLEQTAISDIMAANGIIARQLLSALNTINSGATPYIADQLPLSTTQALPQPLSDEQLILANRLLASSTQMTRIALSESQLSLNNYHLSIALWALSETEKANTYLEKVLAKPSGKTPDNYHLSATIKSQLALEVESFVAYAQFFSTYNERTQTEASNALERLSLMNQWQVNSLANYQFDDLTGWAELYQLTARYASDLAKLERFLSSWQRKHNNHPFSAFTALVVERARLQSQSKINQVAILLPLSGREQAIGQAIQDGILASYQHNKTLTLTFYDTRDQSISDIYQQLLNTNPDFVIGPILKNHVNQYVELDSRQEGDLLASTSAIETNNVLATNIGDSDNSNTLPLTSGQWPSLLLNIADSNAKNHKHYAFSMQPEDEAIQAAEILSHKGYQLPVVISEDSSLGRRVANAFTEQWQRLTQHTPRVLFYAQNNKMEATVREVLAVDQSRARISELKRMMPVNIDTEPRNRRDIDMFYLFGDPAQIQLLKPYIDVSISPFAQAVPIFASSHSFKTDTSVTDKRDLRGLTFSEMPLLIDNSGSNKSMREMSVQLWPQRKNNLKRLYALGLDTLPLLDKLNAMAHYPVIQHKGYTGVLQLDEEQVIRRSLSWATYRKNAITPTAMK